jgi:outer membrane protein with beta-barrel domain
MPEPPKRSRSPKRDFANGPITFAPGHTGYQRGAMGSGARLGGILVLLGLLAPALLLGQGRRASVGAQVGYSRADLGGPDAAGIRARQGALTGVYLTGPFGRILEFRPELLFALKGGRTDVSLEDGTIATLDIDLAYIEVPLLARVTLPTGRFRPVLFGGPATGFQIGCDLQVILPTQPVRSSCREAGVALFRTFDFGVVGGGGVEFGWSQSALSLEARYTAGIRSIVDGATVRNRAFGVMLALTF